MRIESLIGDAWTQAAGNKNAPQAENAKSRFNSRFPHLNIQFYSELTKNILHSSYPKFCANCKTEMRGGISTRETAIRCLKCNYQESRTSYTPLHHLKIPMWTFSYLLVESIERFPQVLNSSEIARKLSVSRNTATLLKRRLQIFLNDLTPAIKSLLVDEINRTCSDLRLPESGDLEPFIAGKPVVSIDGLALFSAQRASNGNRSRWKHTGQTRSVYLTDAVAEEKGKYQIGTLVQTLAIKNGPILLDSVPGFKQKHVEPLLSFLPEHAPIFSDDGYPWLSRYNVNHRSINHSARAKDRRRNVYARNRWSKDSVHNNTAEGVQRIVKHAFISGYSYISPEFSGMYLKEFSALKGVRVYGLGSLLHSSSSLANVSVKLF